MMEYWAGERMDNREMLGVALETDQEQICVSEGVNMKVIKRRNSKEEV